MAGVFGWPAFEDFDEEVFELASELLFPQLEIKKLVAQMSIEIVLNLIILLGVKFTLSWYPIDSCYQSKISLR